MKVGIYPGSFDPITNGHLDIIKRSLELFDKVIVLVSKNRNKQGRFDYETRVKIIEEALKDEKLDERVIVDSYQGLTIDYCKKHNSKFLIRGLRVVSDFEYEWQLHNSNQFIDSDIEMVFLMAKNENAFISSSSILELYYNGVDISSLVPKSVIKYLDEEKN